MLCRYYASDYFRFKLQRLRENGGQGVLALTERDDMLIFGVLIALFIILKILTVVFDDPADLDAENPYLCPDRWAVLPEDMRSVLMPGHKEEKTCFYDRFVKKGIAQIFSFIGILCLIPLFVLTALFIVADDPGPVIFKQKRVGKDMKLFYLHKFRSLKTSAPCEVPTHQMGDMRKYMTRVGSFIRRTSLDELPQLWEIFRGKMSVIGPRPALWNQADLVAARERHGVNALVPGLTGWAQINGRDNIGISEKAELDYEYLRRESFFFDMKCFFLTIRAVIIGEGAR